MIRKLIFVCFFILTTSCAQTDSGGSGSSSSGSSKSYTLTWTPPTSFENNGTLVALDDLSGYRIYFGDSAENVTSNVESISSDKFSFSTDDLDKDIVVTYSTVYVAMTSVSTDGVESALSEIISFTP